MKASVLVIVKSRQQAAGRKRDQGHEATGHEATGHEATGHEATGHELSTHPPAVAKETKETSDNESRD